MYIHKSLKLYNKLDFISDTAQPALHTVPHLHRTALHLRLIVRLLHRK